MDALAGKVADGMNPLWSHFPAFLGKLPTVKRPLNCPMTRKRAQRHTPLLKQLSKQYH